MTRKVNPFFSQPKCLTSLTWLRSPSSTRQSWRRQRQKKKTPCPPKRVSVYDRPFSLFVTCSYILWILCAVELFNILFLNNDKFPCHSLANTNCCGTSPSSSTDMKEQHRLTYSLKMSPLTVSFFFSSFSAIEQERKGDATPWLLSTWKMKLRCHSKKHFPLFITVFESLSSIKGALELPGVL